VQDLLFALLFLGAMLCATLIGMRLSARLPADHQTDPSREAVLRSLGFVVTLTALVIGFLVSSAKAYYAEVEQELTEISSDVAALDRILEHSGPQTEPARMRLRQLIGSAVRTVWPNHATALPKGDGTKGLIAIDRLAEAISTVPASDAQVSALQSQALAYVLAIERSGFKLRRLQEARAQGPLMAIVVSWLVVIFMGFGLLTPVNRTTATATILAAFTAAGAMFLILEFYSPVTGIISIPPSALESAVDAQVAPRIDAQPPAAR
jgi:FtsH-binding integral membrane protein